MRGSEKVKLIAFDVDGTLTNGQLIIGPEGEAYKCFNAHDGLALSLAHRMGYKVGFITGRTSSIVERRAKELHCDFVLMGIKNKTEAMHHLLQQFGLDWDVSGCPSNGCVENRAMADFISRFKGGEGAGREFIEEILKSQGRWEEAVYSFREIDQEELIQ